MQKRNYGWLVMNLKNLGDEITLNIKRQTWFPYKTGNLKFNATKGTLINTNVYNINFDGTIAPYIQYLEEGTDPHNIFNAFGGTVNPDGSWNYWQPYKDGVKFPFGIGGRFNGKFHPGSHKHEGFISNKAVNYIIQYVCNKYKGEVR